jgi:protein involved in ribonucleotide reduction
MPIKMNCETDFSLVPDFLERNISVLTCATYLNGGKPKDLSMTVSEIESLLKQGVKHFHVKDIFANPDKGYLREFCISMNTMKYKYNFRYSCDFNASQADRFDKAVTALYNSGLRQLCIVD